MVGRTLARIVGAAARRPLPVLAVTTVLVVVATVLAVGLTPSAATDTLVGRGSPEYRASAHYHAKFGDDAVIVLVKEQLPKLVLTSDIERVLGLEGCISGNLPKHVTPRGGLNGPCGQLAKTKPVKVVYGPGTFINASVSQISDQFSAETRQAQADAKKVAEAARKLALARGMSPAAADKLAKEAAQLRQAQFVRDIVRLGLKYGLTRPPTLNDTQFVSKLVFANTESGTPKTRFAYLFPNRNSALVQVRLKPTLSEAERRRAISLIRQAVAMPDWHLANGSYVVTGAPVVVSDLTSRISRSIVILLIAALLVMAGTLAVVFRSRLRLLPLLVALAAAALTFGGLALAGASLTMASIAVLPVLIGLAVDYAIQFQSRVAEVGRPERAALLGGPTILTAGAATAAGFLVLLLSPVPMVRSFGALLVIGVVIALAMTFTAGTALLSALGGRSAPKPLRRPLDALSAAWAGAGELLTQNRPARWTQRTAARAGNGAFAAATGRPQKVLMIAAAAAVLGWALDTQTHVESDIAKLVPQDLGALRDLNALEKATSVGGEIDVVVDSDKLTEPATVQWMTAYQKKLVDHYGYSAKRGCGKAQLCPAFSLPDLFAGGGAKTRTDIEALLDAVPPYFSQGVITGDRRTATLAFGIRLMPLDQQEDVIRTMRSALKPPAGVHAELAGLPVLAAEANARIASPWRRALQLLVGLLAVALVLLVALRNVRRALLPLVPIALATGWSALVLFLTRIPLNPMSVTLGALVIAISTEFSVLLSERYRQEREAGAAPTDALRRTYDSTGRAVAASGITAIAGFAVLIVSDIRMLRDFGLVTVIDLTVSLLGVLVVLPAALLLAERGVRVPRPAVPRRPLRAR